MSKKSKLLVLLLLSTNLIASNVINSMAVRLKSNNGYLEKNSKSNLLAYVMIYYNDMKREVAVNLKTNKQYLTDLSILFSEYKNYSVEQSSIILENFLLNSTSPTEFFNKIKSLT